LAVKESFSGQNLFDGEIASIAGMRSVPILCLLALAAPAADNTLTSAEKDGGWKLLFDGKTMKNWRDPSKRNPVGDAWEISGGALKTRVHPRLAEDLVSAESYGDFELLFEWRVSPGGNTGLKYRLQRFVFIDDTKKQEGEGGFEGMIGREIANPKSDRSKMAPNATGSEYTVGYEFQLIDDKRHADALKDKRHTTGALYSMIAPSAVAAQPAGEWNQARLVLKGNHVEHWINGTKVLDASLDDPAVEAGASKRWGKVPAVHDALVHPKPQGPLALQHHGDEVWFRNIKIRPL
jgi:hypothetical protein